MVEYNRVELSCAIDEWFEQALNYPGVRLLELTPAIAIASTVVYNFLCEIEKVRKKGAFPL